MCLGYWYRVPQFRSTQPTGELLVISFQYTESVGNGTALLQSGQVFNDVYRL